MNRLAPILAAATVVVAAHLWGLRSSWQNRSHAAGGTVELTEREVTLPPIIGDSTALDLGLRWEFETKSEADRGTPDWLDATKLAELGFDCRLAPTHPEARDHYDSQPARPVYLVIEYGGEAWRASERRAPSGPAKRDPQRDSRLFAVDAGQDPGALRQKYPDTAQYLITRGVVRITRRGATADEPRSGQPRLRGWVEVVPGRIFVPRPHCQVLQGLRHREGERPSPPATPRYAVTVSWGTRYEPWVQAVRLLPGAATEPGREP